VNDPGDPRRDGSIERAGVHIEEQMMVRRARPFVRRGRQLDAAGRERDLHGRASHGVSGSGTIDGHAGRG